MEEPAELAISWDTTLAVSKDVHSCDVPCLFVRGSDLAQEVRVVIVGYGTRIVNAKTVEGVSEGGCFVDRILSI